MNESVTVIQMWGPLVGAAIAALAGIKSWRIVGRTEGILGCLQRDLENAIEDIEQNREKLHQHSSMIQGLATSLTRFDGVPRMIETLQKKVDRIYYRLDIGGGHDEGVSARVD